MVTTVANDYGLLGVEEAGVAPAGCHFGCWGGCWAGGACWGIGCWAGCWG
jgi:hypothetical protein